MKNVILFFFLPFTLMSQSSELNILNCEEAEIGLDRYCQALGEIEYGASTSCEDGLIDWHIFVDMGDDGMIDYFLTPEMDIRSTYTAVPKFLGNGELNPAYENLPEGYEYAEFVYVNGIAPTTSGVIGKRSIEVVVGGTKVNVYKKAFTECGDTADCSYSTYIEDREGPTPYVIDLTSADFRCKGNAQLQAVDYNKGSYDNCTDLDDLLYTFYGIEPVNYEIVIKDDVGYIIDINMPHFFDANGFVDFDSDGVTPYNGIIYPATKEETIETFINSHNVQYSDKIQKWIPENNSSIISWNDRGVHGLVVSIIDSQRNISSATITLAIYEVGPPEYIRGRILKPNGDSFDHEVKVIIDAAFSEFPLETTTSEGEFYFEWLPLNLNCKLSVEGNGQVRNGVSTVDLVLVMRHLMGISLFDDVHQVIASDINEDDAITPQDLTVMRNIILNIPTPDINAYKFFDRRQVFDGALNPWPLQDTVKFKIGDCEDPYDFTVVKLGDVNGTAMKVRSGETVNLIYADDQELKKGQIIELPISIESEEMIFALEAHLSMEGLEYIGPSILNNQLYINVEHDNLHMMGAMPLGIDARDLNELPKFKFRVTKDIMLADALTFMEGKEHAMYVGDNLEEVSLDLTFDENQRIKEIIVYPNPMNEVSNVAFHAQEVSSVEISLYNMQGILVGNLKGVEVLQGNNIISIGDLLPSIGGLYMLSIKEGGEENLVKVAVLSSK